MRGIVLRRALIMSLWHISHSRRHINTVAALRLGLLISLLLLLRIYLSLNLRLTDTSLHRQVFISDKALEDQMLRFVLLFLLSLF